MKVKITLIEEMLGTACQNKQVHEEYIASKSADAEKTKEELKALHADELMTKETTVFPKDEDGNPFIWDYQIKGFIKEATGVLVDLQEKEIKVGKSKLSKYTHKRFVDNFIFVLPRKIKLNLSGETGICTRPLRADTMKGERVSLASSETVPAGTWFECEIKTMHAKLDDLVEQCLDYGALKGLGQWRNSGKGKFKWDQVE